MSAFIRCLHECCALLYREPLILLLIIVLLLIMIVTLLFRIQHIKREFAASKMMDAETGIGNLQFCSRHEQNSGEKEFADSIVKGIENNEFKMFLQFIVDSKTQQIVSAEALSRWDSPERGLIGPFHYIGEMESAGLISAHDFYMFNMACKQLELWSNTDYKDVTISCNFTRITLSEDDFIEKLSTISNGYQFDKSKLSIEITEDAIEHDMETAKLNVRKCKELGFRIYLDDLGNGYTSLSNLCDYPIDVVKVDRDILLKTDTERGKHLLAGIVALSHGLDIAVVCEGVETEEQSRLVVGLGCDFIQGWYYSKPIPLSECEAFIQKFCARQ